MEYARIEFQPELRRLQSSPEAHKIEKLLRRHKIGYNTVILRDAWIHKQMFPRPELMTPFGRFVGFVGADQYINLVRTSPKVAGERGKDL